MPVNYTVDAPSARPGNKNAIIDGSGLPAARDRYCADSPSTMHQPLITQQAAAAERNQGPAMPPPVITDVSVDIVDKTISVSADRETQTVKADSPEISARPDAYNSKFAIAKKKFRRNTYLQRQRQQVNAAKMPESIPVKNVNRTSKTAANVSTAAINRDYGHTPAQHSAWSESRGELYPRDGKKFWGACSLV